MLQCDAARRSALHYVALARAALLRRHAVTVCCSMLQCVAVRRRSMQYVALGRVALLTRHCSQFVAVCCSASKRIAFCCTHMGGTNITPLLTVCYNVLQCVAVRCGALQCVAVCCSAPQCLALTGVALLTIHCSRTAKALADAREPRSGAKLGSEPYGDASPELGPDPHELPEFRFDARAPPPGLVVELPV